VRHHVGHGQYSRSGAFGCESGVSFHRVDMAVYI
jgi:hypothetical protein